MAKSGHNLNPRTETILCALIESYMANAGPVGSERLRQQHGLPWSSATIRNELAAMESQGLLTHSHTSAGRTPTAVGMRYYVDFLLGSAEVTMVTRDRVNQALAAAGEDPLQLSLIVSQLLSRLSHHVSLVQALHEGNKNCVIAGKENFLGQPEFSDSLKLKDFFRVLEEQDVQDCIFRSTLTSGPVHVSIGSEHLPESYRELFEDISLVTSAFGRNGRTTGAIGVIGPKRMDYRKMIPLVDYTAQSVCRLLAQN